MYVPPEEKYRLVRRTKRGTLVVIEKEGNKAILEVTNHKDIIDISDLLNAAGVRWTMYHKEKTFVPHEKRYGHAWIVEFDFSDLEEVIMGLEDKEFLLE